MFSSVEFKRRRWLAYNMSSSLFWLIDEVINHFSTVCVPFYNASDFKSMYRHNMANRNLSPKSLLQTTVLTTHESMIQFRLSQPFYSLYMDILEMYFSRSCLHWLSSEKMYTIVQRKVYVQPNAGEGLASFRGWEVHCLERSLCP